VIGLDHETATTAGKAAWEIARRYYPDSLFNHCVRSYLFARDYASHHDLAPDREVLFVAAMLHDLALTEVFDSATTPFEETGGHLAWVFAAAAGWPAERRNRVADVIEQHMWDAVPVEVGVEGFLLEIATSLDISGRNVEHWTVDFAAHVVAAHPRLDLADTFADCFDAQARRKPQSRAAQAARNGMRARLRSNPLNEL
jgi:HD superfamily phosphodiesterase